MANTTLKYQKRIIRNRKIVADYKSTHPCTICGETRLPCLDFHHPNDDKSRTVCWLTEKGRSKKQLLEEMAKCIIVCANCHRIIHWDEQH
jgi:hypothetical protein